jgi:HSP20 family protein
MMSALFGPSSDLFSELDRLQGVLDQVRRPAGTSSIRALSGASFPAINVGTTPEAVEVLALAPGLDPSSLQITVDRGLLVIAGERKAAPSNGAGEGNGQQGGQSGSRQEVNVYARERFTGSFRRVLSLPEDADPAKVEANYRDGVLRITVGRRESSRPRRIEVN